ncbi:T9SS type A sorting domain-containing protein [Carboxylicivirga sp. A043]|uniref:T9SS type A sorting domain-containing protein n=1 Tax=Carboxylicivirga litoralis TaxID=2816963 RepID=UPI0021CB4B32|nr:T9SS type A sorting domain-containing protein [Carboxylicivirga sp. A043]MCU4158220.1 T9SS type A sorting domain-containing protein [Carboxylicivirga sp. A043]
MTKFITLWAVILICTCTSAQLSVQQLNQTTTITFNQTTDGINNGSFNGSGFTPSPTDGQLNSNGIIVTGCSDGDLNFGDTNSEGDFARGRSNGNKTSGGIYAFEISDNNVALGVQPAGSDMTPGDIIIKIINNTGFNAKSIDISYDIYELNNENRSCSVIVSTSVDNTTYIHHLSLDYTTVEAENPSPQWIVQNQSINWVTDLQINSEYYLKFTIDDNGGSGSRDEIAIDNIGIRLNGTATHSPEQLSSLFRINPNPADSYISVSSIVKIDKLEIYNTTGAKVKQFNTVTNNGAISVADLARGIYVVKVEFTDKTVSTRKLVIR